VADHDVFVPNGEHRALWAGGLAEDLGGLMARWLEGRTSYEPGYLAAGPDAETASLVPVLAQLNRAGYVTDFSQPGIALDANGNGQRAADFTSPCTAARLTPTPPLRRTRGGRPAEPIETHAVTARMIIAPTVTVEGQGWSALT
jgi:hypothetical protein